jgi:hypothetical protein
MSTNDDLFWVVLSEFNAFEGSFLLQLRIDLHWDREAFTRLAQTMIQCCRIFETEHIVPKWIAEGFWDIPSFVRGHTAHSYWDKLKATDPAYFEASYELLDDLACWFFTGQYPKLGGPPSEADV